MDVVSNQNSRCEACKTSSGRVEITVDVAAPVRDRFARCTCMTKLWYVMESSAVCGAWIDPRIFPMLSTLVNAGEPRDMQDRVERTSCMTILALAGTANAAQAFRSPVLGAMAGYWLLRVLDLVARMQGQEKDVKRARVMLADYLARLKVD